VDARDKPGHDGRHLADIMNHVECGLKPWPGNGTS
jgi:hypothetical protein